MKNAKTGIRIAGEPRKVWLITFCDLITILLAMFVLIFSMYTVDRSLLTEISSAFSSSTTSLKARVKPSTNTSDMTAMLKTITGQGQPSAQDIDKLKRMLSGHGYSFSPDELDIRAQSDGIVLILNNDQLFREKSTALSGEGKTLLQQMAGPLMEINLEINISGHYAQYGSKSENYRRSMEAALGVLRELESLGMRPGRMSLSAYGADRPSAATPRGRTLIENGGCIEERATSSPESLRQGWENRIEILIKNNRLENVRGAVLRQ